MHWTINNKSTISSVIKQVKAVKSKQKCSKTTANSIEQARKSQCMRETKPNFPFSQKPTNLGQQTKKKRL